MYSLEMLSNEYHNIPLCGELEKYGLYGSFKLSGQIQQMTN